jgi:hypothetical protein
VDYIQLQVDKDEKPLRCKPFFIPVFDVFEDENLKTTHWCIQGLICGEKFQWIRTPVTIPVTIPDAILFG